MKADPTSVFASENEDLAAIRRLFVRGFGVQMVHSMVGGARRRIVKEFDAYTKEQTLKLRNQPPPNKLKGPTNGKR